MKQPFIPRDATVAELERKAAECERKAASEQEPRATELRDEAKLYREWATALRRTLDIVMPCHIPRKLLGVIMQRGVWQMGGRWQRSY